mgnify:CR=1 FL=1
MKKSILLAIGFILSSYSYADIDLSKNYGGATEWGYSGFEFEQSEGGMILLSPDGLPRQPYFLIGTAVAPYSVKTSQ